MSLIKVEFKLLDDRAEVPQRATEGSAGYDVKALLDEPITLLCGERRLIPTGYSIYVSDQEYALFLLPRSGLGHKNGIVLGNLTGLIDSDYQGQIMVSLWNSGLEPFTIKHGDAIAQMVFKKVEHPIFVSVTEFTDNTIRGEGGFGSTTSPVNEAVTKKVIDMNALILQTEKTYANRHGDIVRIVGINRNPDFPFVGDNGLIYNQLGQNSSHVAKNGAYDLIKEVLEPEGL